MFSSATASKQVNTMSITRALVELKTLDKRINKQTTQGVFVSTQVHGQNIDDVRVNDALANYQSTRDLHKRYNAIKSAIVLSNAKTEVVIGGNEYTVSEAIDRKHSIKYEKQLLETLRQQRQNAKYKIETHTREVERNLDAKLDQLYGSASKNKADSTKDFREEFLKSREMTMVDPLKVDEKIDELYESVTEFEKEVDFVLSESNAKTEISV